MKFLKLYQVIIVLYALYFSLSSFAQTSDYISWKTNYDKGVELVEKDSLIGSLSYLIYAKNIAQKLFKNTSDDYIISLEKLALVYNSLGQESKALTLYLESIEISKLKKTDKGLKFAETLKTLYSIYIKLKNNDEAVKAREYANQVIKEFYGENDINYIHDLSYLTIIYSDLSLYNKGLKNQKQVLKYFENKDKTSDYYAYACFAMYYLYFDINEYEKAIDFLKKAIAIYGEDHPASSTFNNNIGLSYQNLGNQEKALSYFLTALKKSKNKEDFGYATRLENLAFTYVLLGEYEKAKNIYDEVLNLWNKKLDKNHNNYARLLNNIGKLYRQTSDFKKAKQLFKDALDNFLLNFGKNHSKYGYMLNDYASMLLELDQENEAIELMKENLQIAIDNEMIDTEDFYGRQHNLAKAYNRIGLFREAKPLLESAVKNIPLILGKEHPKYGEMLKSLSDTYVGIGDIENAISLIKSSNNILINQIDQIFKFRSEKEKQSFLKMLSTNFDKLQSIPLTNEGDFENLNTINLNNQLMLKGLLLNNSKNILSQLSTLNDPEVENDIIIYKTLKQQLAQVLTEPISERKINIDSLKNIINTEEASLVKMHSEYFSSNLSLVKDWRQSKFSLKDKEIAIEFSHFKLTNKIKPSDTIMYVAYVYKSNSEYPKLIPLFEQQELSKLIDSNNTNELYQINALYDLILNPLEEYINGVNTIYYSPSGLLNQIQLAAITNNTKSITDQFNLIQLSSTSNLANKLSEPNITSALFVGGVDYDYTETATKKADSNTIAYLDTNNIKGLRASKSRGESWNYLPGTLMEINQLQNIIKTHENEISTLTGNKATETNFKKLSGNSPNIIHIATHGFFFENQNIKPRYGMSLSTEDQYRLAEDPLLRSGIMMAGANYAWKHGSNPMEDDDGILTAMEISNLDLSDTDMVVLSACETGLGDIDGSEGVYGLQRAFKMAGVNIIVMSLWQVPDKETAEFMTMFYSKWKASNNVREAFNITQRSMQHKYKKEPEKWAAFVLFE